jgi:DNA-binding transcriptional regulator YdaS (Cro superfamily)
MIPILQRCAELVGGVSKLAALLGIRHQSFYSWHRIPAERVLDVERVTGIPRHELRPDLYPQPESAT